MAAKYHVGEQGPGICHASKRPCPLGGPEVHFDDPRKAQKAFEKKMADEHGNFNVHSNPKLPPNAVSERELKPGMKFMEPHGDGTVHTVEEMTVFGPKTEAGLPRRRRNFGAGTVRVIQDGESEPTLAEASQELDALARSSEGVDREVYTAVKGRLEAAAKMGFEPEVAQGLFRQSLQKDVEALKADGSSLASTYEHAASVALKASFAD